MVVNHVRQESQPITAPTRNWWLSASYDSFMVAQTFILRMNIYVKNLSTPKIGLDKIWQNVLF
jgi:hypothetical protein